MQKPFLTALWRYIVVFNYEVTPSLLLPYLPADIELDFYQGRSFVSIVALLWLETHLPLFEGLKQRNFEELQLRFYAKRRSADTWRRGVCFIRRVVPAQVAATLARAFPADTFGVLPLKSEVVDRDGELAINYCWKDASKWRSMEMRAASEPAIVTAGTEEDFLTDRRWCFSQFRGACNEYRVERPRWKVWQPTSAVLDGRVTTLFPAEFAATFHAEPVSRFIADGSALRIWRREDDPVLVEAMARSWR